MDLLFASIAATISAGTIVILSWGILHDVFGIGPEPDIRLGDDIPADMPKATRRQRIWIAYPFMAFFALFFAAICWPYFTGQPLFGGLDAFLRATFQ